MVKNHSNDKIRLLKLKIYYSDSYKTKIFI